MEPKVNEQGQPIVDDSPAIVDPAGDLPSNQEVQKTPEELIAALTAERDQAKKDHSELEKLLGKKANEAGIEKQEQAKALEETERRTAQEEYVKSIVDDVVTSGMSISDEMTAKLTELGVSENDVKLKAYEYKDKIDAVVQVFGDRATYDEAVKFGADNGYTQEQLAAHGLKSLYGQVNGQPTSDRRIEGYSTPAPTQRGYASVREYNEDLAYARQNPSAMKGIREKLAKSDKSDWKIA